MKIERGPMVARGTSGEAGHELTPLENFFTER
jgi:hypothetical protein